MKELIEVFVARGAEDIHSFWTGEPESIGFFTEEEIERGEEKEYGGPGTYSYDSPS